MGTESVVGRARAALEAAEERYQKAAHTAAIYPGSSVILRILGQAAAEKERAEADYEAAATASIRAQIETIAADREEVEEDGDTRH